ncbi:MAG TPA: DUF5659 domain-containing protein [Roseiarcus sp.]|nr:DUF5659 domain-containing protein [Roseiarcus sp.]
MFETRDFYLACFLRCAGYELLNLREEGRRKVFVFQDRATRRADVMAFYGDATSVRPLAFAATIKLRSVTSTRCANSAGRAASSRTRCGIECSVTAPSAYGWNPRPRRSAIGRSPSRWS